MKQVLIFLLGASWRTTLVGLVEATALQGLTYAINTEFKDPKIFWCGMGMSIITVIRGRLTKDAEVSNSPHPLAIAQTVEAK